MTKLVIVSNPYVLAMNAGFTPFWQVRKNGAVGVPLITVGTKEEAEAFVKGWFDAAVEELTNQVNAIAERERDRRRRRHMSDMF